MSLLKKGRVSDWGNDWVNNEILQKMSKLSLQKMDVERIINMKKKKTSVNPPISKDLTI
jgi:hypothetical protein